MGLINSLATSGLGLLGIDPKQTVKAPINYGPDYPEGLILTEIKTDGTEDVANRVQLVGVFMPHVPLEYGGTQSFIKEYYPGNPEPSVQVLGSRESDTTVRGVLKTVRFKDKDKLREAALEYQELIDAMRIRGNLVRIELNSATSADGNGGGFYRYGFVEETKFKLNRKQDIEYEIRLFIVGFNPPTLDKSTKSDGKVTAPNRELINQAAKLLSEASLYPTSMPITIAERLNNLISGVATNINLVTSFVDGIQSDAKDLLNSANRAIGLIKNARAYISRSKRTMGQIVTDAKNLAPSFVSESKKTSSTLLNVAHLHKVDRTFSTLASQLALLQATFAKIAQTVPMMRHLVQSGDTLQTLAIRYYSNSDLWTRIYEHNKLNTTVLKIGSVLEIPKL